LNPIGDFKPFRLSNGLRLRLRRDTSLPLASFQVWVRCGSVDEDRPVAGIAHFMEHMVFKASPSARDLSRIVESSGGVINAATQHELTHYYTDIPKEGLEAAIDALGAALTEPQLTP
jgi:predicted Zn-dependent peptidase